MQPNDLRPRRVTAANAFFLGAVLALIALAPAIVPYGGRFVTRGDYIEQQLPFILETPSTRWAARSSGRWRCCRRRWFRLASA